MIKENKACGGEEIEIPWRRIPCSFHVPDFPTSSAPSVEGGAGLHLENFWVPLNLPKSF